MKKGEQPRTNVTLPDLLRDLNIRAINSTDEQAAVEAELHVRRARGLRTGGRDVLADVRRGDEDLGERDGVVGKEEQAQQVLGVRIVVNHASDVDDEADRELGNVV